MSDYNFKTFLEVSLRPAEVCVLLKELSLWAQSLNKAAGCTTNKRTPWPQPAFSKHVTGI